MPAPIAITGASGNAGQAVIAALRARGVPVRPLLREPVGDAVGFDFLRPDTFEAAVAGAAGLFLLRPPPISDVGPTLNRLVDVALAAGVPRIVFLSVIGADTRGYIPHAKVEKHLKGSAAAWTFLRAGFFAQNLGDAYRRDITRDGRIYVPAGSGRVAFIDARDIAEVAAMALLDPAAHAGRAYTLTGPAAIPFGEAARLLSQRLGRPIRYQPASVLGYVRHLLRQGAPVGQAAVLTILHLGLRLGQAASSDPTLARLLGRPGRTLAEYIADHADLFTAERP